jgi:hypothetical protein
VANNQLATRSRFYISSSSARNKKLLKVKTCKVTDNRDGEHAKGAGEKKPVGVIRKPGGGTLELAVYTEKGTPEVDWYALEDSEEFFEFTREIVEGARRQFLECTVVNVGEDDDDEGNHMLTVKILFSESKPL